MSSRRLLPDIAAAVFAFFASMAMILAATWPWALHFGGEFLDHWDPPFHAWKLEFMARRILAGDLFMASGNTNMLYPHSGALYFEALQWPMALFAAPLFALSRLPSESIYHITLLFFWALSAPCLYFLLRELECGRMASAAGAIVFCILPHRISYMVEFQMEMVFAMPLFFAFAIRFFRSRRPADAILAALSWWLFAVSELYEAVFAAMAAPFVAIAFLAWRPDCLKSRRFWLSALAAVLVGAALLCVLLLTYASLHSDGQVLRPLKEVALHSFQPFSFLIPFGRYQPWTVDARKDEFSLYPTIAVLAFAAGGAVLHFARTFSLRRRQPLQFALAVAALASGMAFFSIAGAIQFHAVAPSRFAFRCLKYASFAFIAAPLAFAFIPDRGDSARSVFLKALFAVSVFFLFLSFGPSISFGAGRHVFAARTNPIYIFCHETLLPFLSGFRVVSRFGVIVLFFLVCAASATLDAAIGALPQPGGAGASRTWAGRFLRLAVPFAVSAAFVAFVALEAIPPERKVSSYRPVDDQRASPAIRRLVESHPIATIAAIPAGPRHIEGMRMFSLLKGDWPYVYVWGGFFPEFSRRLVETMMSFDSGETHRELARFFPPCLMVIDNGEPVFPKRPFPGKYARRVNGRKAVDFVALYSEIADAVDSDGRFTVMRLRPLPPAPSASRIFRSDIARRNPMLSCSVAGMPGTPVSFSLNDVLLARTTIPGAGVIDFSCVIDPQFLSEKPFNDFIAASGDASPISIENFSLVSRSGAYDDVCAPYASR